LGLEANISMLAPGLRGMTAWLQNQSPQIPYSGVPVFPTQGSDMARNVDYLYFYLVAVTVFFTVGIFLAIFYFAIKYRRREDDEVGEPIHGSTRLEIIWSVIPFLITMVMFGWGASLFYDMYQPPQDAMQLTVVGKQWMWKVQHATGQREINEVHVPVGKPVKLVMTSEDVIHSFYLPVFRVKKDVIPGRITQLWFTPTTTGTFHLFCAEYCGTKHAGMGGRVVVMEPAEFQAWLAGAPAGETLEQAGARLFKQFNCATCHEQVAGARGPALENILGRSVELQGGGKITVDETYLRESILQPSAKLVAGYENVMPAYQGQISEEGILQLIAYVKSLTKEERKAAQK